MKQAVKGYRKCHSHKDTCRPVSFSIIQVICENLGSVCSLGYEMFLFRAAFSVAFFGSFRVGELVSPSRRVAGGFLARDVLATENRVVLRLSQSKTDQRGKAVSVKLYSLPGSRVCPMRGVRDFLEVHPVGGGPILVHGDGSYLSGFQFISVFRKCLSAAGFDCRQFASHSFRIGVATEATWWGLDDLAVRRIGHWESRRFCFYVCPQMLSDLILGGWYGL